MTDDPYPAAPGPSARAPRGEATGTRVLLVDDESTVRIPLARALSRRGFLVDTAERGDQVLPAIARSRPDVLLLDVGLPGMSGLDVLAAVVAQDPLLAVVMLSGAAERSVARLAIAAGATDFVLKPVTADVLAEVVRGASHARVVRARQDDAAAAHRDAPPRAAEPTIEVRESSVRS